MTSEQATANNIVRLADLIDNRLGPISGKDADQLAVALREANAVLTALLSDRESLQAQAAVLVGALKSAHEMERMLSGAVSAASCETQDCESEPWERLVHGYWFDGVMASYCQEIEQALKDAPTAASALLLEVEGLKRQRDEYGKTLATIASDIESYGRVIRDNEGIAAVTLEVLSDAIMRALRSEQYNQELEMDVSNWKARAEAAETAVAKWTKKAAQRRTKLNKYIRLLEAAEAAHKSACACEQTVIKLRNMALDQAQDAHDWQKRSEAAEARVAKLERDLADCHADCNIEVDE